MLSISPLGRGCTAHAIYIYIYIYMTGTRRATHVCHDCAEFTARSELTHDTTHEHDLCWDLGSFCTPGKRISQKTIPLCWDHFAHQISASLALIPGRCL